MVSAVFASRSPSAGAPLGAIRFAALIRGAATPVIALGGVNETTAPRLTHTGASALAAVDGLTMLGD
jgi:thiamine-phosphate pyrophosphorylase